MIITTKSRFAVTSMVDLGLRSNSGLVALASIGQRHNISLSYLEQIFGYLRRSDLVSSARGPRGGYELARDASTITVMDVVRSIEEPNEATQCCGKQNCDEKECQCMTRELWNSMHSCMSEFLESITIQSLISKQIADGFEVEKKVSDRKPIFDLPAAKKINLNIPNSVFALGSSKFNWDINGSFLKTC